MDCINLEQQERGMSKDNSGPAFPHEFEQGSMAANGMLWRAHPGMSLRDWFAGQALQTAATFMMVKYVGEDDPDIFLKAIAVIAYDMADAMLKARGAE
jgi:hypothetical protein